MDCRTPPVVENVESEELARLENWLDEAKENGPIARPSKGGCHCGEDCGAHYNLD